MESSPEVIKRLYGNLVACQHYYLWTVRPSSDILGGTNSQVRLHFFHFL